MVFAAEYKGNSLAEKFTLAADEQLGSGDIMAAVE